MNDEEMVFEPEENTVLPEHIGVRFEPRGPLEEAVAQAREERARLIREREARFTQFFNNIPAYNREGPVPLMDPLAEEPRTMPAREWATLFPPRDPNRLTSADLRLLADSDPERRIRPIQCEHCESYNWRRCISGTWSNVQYLYSENGSNIDVGEPDDSDEIDYETWECNDCGAIPGGDSLTRLEALGEGPH